MDDLILIAALLVVFGVSILCGLVPADDLAEAFGDD
jgi:hypothetical protein